MDRLKAVDDDVVSQTLKYHLDDQNGVFDIKSDTGINFYSGLSSLIQFNLISMLSFINTPIREKAKLWIFEDRYLFT